MLLFLFWGFSGDIAESKAKALYNGRYERASSSKIKPE